MPTESFTEEFDVRPMPERPVRRSALRGYALVTFAVLTLIALMALYNSKEQHYRACVFGRVTLDPTDHWSVPPSTNAVTRRCANGWPDWMLW